MFSWWDWSPAEVIGMLVAKKPKWNRGVSDFSWNGPPYLALLLAMRQQSSYFLCFGPTQWGFPSTNKKGRRTRGVTVWGDALHRPTGFAAPCQDSEISHLCSSARCHIIGLKTHFRSRIPWIPWTSRTLTAPSKAKFLKVQRTTAVVQQHLNFLVRHLSMVMFSILKILPTLS